MRWRPTLRALHRDIGFLCVGLTLAYGVSGIAVNHAHHWDYNRSERVESKSIGKPAELLEGLPSPRKAALEKDHSILSKDEEALLVEGIGKKVGRHLAPRNVFWQGPNQVRLFYGEGDQDTVDYDPNSGVVTQIVRKKRWLLRELHFLHLNEARKWWTYIADSFALMLLFLAVSGAIIVKGKRGLRGRGGVLLAIGLALPIFAWLVLH